VTARKPQSVSRHPLLPNDRGQLRFTMPEAVAYDMAAEVIGGPAGAPESGTPA
jgi:hypothetical protein